MIGIVLYLQNILGENGMLITGNLPIQDAACKFRRIITILNGLNKSKEELMIDEHI